jgi:phage terminase small subunit
MTIRKRKGGLTIRQERFVSEYLVDFNGSAAAMRAGYSHHSAKKTAHELLTEYPRVIEAVERGVIQLAQKAELSQQWVVGELRQNHYLARAQRELPASNKALELLGKHIGMWKDDAGTRVAVFNLQINL